MTAGGPDDCHRQGSHRFQTEHAGGLVLPHHSQALVAHISSRTSQKFPTTKNKNVVPAYTDLERPSGRRYIATGGPPAWAIIDVIPEAVPARIPFARDEGDVRPWRRL
jgi:hypothetical protein